MKRGRSRLIFFKDKDKAKDKDVPANCLLYLSLLISLLYFLTLTDWTAASMEFLIAETLPVRVVADPPKKDDWSSKMFAYFISRTFNGSFYWDITNNRRILAIRQPFLELQIVTSPINVIDNSASVVYFQPITSKGYLVVSASGLKYYVTFVDYFFPFQRSVWICLIFISIFIALILRILFSRNVFLLLFSFLLEQPDNISKKLANCCPFHYILIPLLFMFLILSNAYKVIVITSLVKSFEALGLNLEEGVRMGHKLYYMPDHTRDYEYCCNQPEQFDTISEE